MDTHGHNKRSQQLILEDLFDKNKLVPAVKANFANLSDSIAKEAKVSDIPEGFILDFLVQVYLHKQASPNVIVGALIKWGDYDSAKVIGWIETLILKDWADYNPVTKKIVMKWTVDPATEEAISKFQYPMPMLVEPEKLERNTDTGYLTDFRTGILLNKSLHNGDVCLDLLNKVNKVELCLNFDTVRATNNEWANLSEPKQGESKEDFDTRVAAHKRYVEKSGWLHELVEKTGNKFYLTHAYDKRGRLYCNGYFIDYQGHCYNKAVVEFRNKEIV